MRIYCLFTQIFQAIPGEPKEDSGIHAFTKAHRPGSIQTKGARETHIQTAVA
jgi:hypothetical protein